MSLWSCERQRRWTFLSLVADHRWSQLREKNHWKIALTIGGVASHILKFSSTVQRWHLTHYLIYKHISFDIFFFSSGLRWSKQFSFPHRLFVFLFSVARSSGDNFMSSSVSFKGSLEKLKQHPASTRKMFPSCFCIQLNKYRTLQEEAGVLCVSFPWSDSLEMRENHSRTVFIWRSTRSVGNIFEGSARRENIFIELRGK